MLYQTFEKLHTVLTDSVCETRGSGATLQVHTVTSPVKYLGSVSVGTVSLDVHLLTGDYRKGSPIR